MQPQLGIWKRFIRSLLGVDVVGDDEGVVGDDEGAVGDDEGGSGR